MTWKWFFSATIRQAGHACNHVAKILDHQRDLLAAPAVEAVNSEIAAVRQACAAGSKANIHEAVARLEKAANKWLKPYPNAAWRENIEVMLVAIAVAMAIRTFFLQPFKIPTGSMQPTLYGVTEENLLRGQTDVKVPGAIEGFLEYWFRGISYKHVVARAPGQLERATEPTKFILFNLKQQFYLTGDPKPYTVWFPPDGLLARAGLIDSFGQPSPKSFAAGEDLIKLRIISGDHLFVDRVSYNFRRPARGDIVVFETHGITRLDRDQQDTYYIKRLVSPGGETLALKTDYEVTSVPREGVALAGHLVVDGKDLSASTPHFEHLYAFQDAPRRAKMISYRENHYHGHGLLRGLAPGREFQVPPDEYFVMGDNTFNSSDSRYFGSFPQDRVIGKSCFVYWPIGGTKFKSEERTSRFGWSHR